MIRSLILFYFILFYFSSLVYKSGEQQLSLWIAAIVDSTETIDVKAIPKQIDLFIQR